MQANDHQTTIAAEPSSGAPAGSAPDSGALEPIKSRDPDFGRKVAALALAKTGKASFGGRRPIAEKYADQLGQAEELLAASLVQTVKDYIAELRPKEPETCPYHKRVLQCPVEICDHESQRTSYNHAAAAYHMDRMFGRPTSRSENTITIKLASALLERFAEAFEAVNDLPDRAARKRAMAEHFDVLTAEYTRVS